MVLYVNFKLIQIQSNSNSENRNKTDKLLLAKSLLEVLGVTQIFL